MIVLLRLVTHLLLLLVLLALALVVIVVAHLIVALIVINLVVVGNGNRALDRVLRVTNLLLLS